MLDTLDWPVEDVPDSDDVFMRAHRDFFRNKKLQPGVFRPHDGGMSVDWEKYSSPDDTRQRAKVPQDNAVICLPVVGIRAINKLNVKHTPQATNRAHADVIGFQEGEDITEMRVGLLSASIVVISL